MKGGPDALAIWRAALREVAPDLLVGMAPWLNRLAGFFGPFPLPRSGEGGEPQGYQGLTRKGSWERLLASEWALLQVAPLEFQRRSIAGEQLYFSLARQQAFGGRRCVVLVDAGPYQLGNARLAQMAILSVLAERARASGAEFLWSAWQARPGELDSGFESASLRRFLTQRSHRSVTDELVAPWLAALDRQEEGEERWSIGAASVADLGRFKEVTLRDKEAPAKSMLEVHWQAEGQPLRSLDLPLPPEVERIRWLRDPCHVVSRETLLEGRIRGAHFGFRADRLLVRVGKGLVVYHVPKELDAPAGQTRFFDLEEGEQLVAAGNTGARLFVVLKQGENIAFHRVDRGERRDLGPLVVEARGVDAWHEEEGFGICLGDPAAPKRRFFFEDGGHSVQVLEFAEGRIALSKGKVLSLFCAGSRVMTLGRSGREALEVWDSATGAWGIASHIEHDDILTAFAGHASLADLRSARLGRPGIPVAFEIESAVWDLGRYVLRPGASCRVVGVASNPAMAADGLLAIEADGRTLVHVGLAFTRTLHKALSPIRGVAVAHDRPILALWTEGHALELISLEDGKSRTLRQEEI